MTDFDDFEPPPEVDAHTGKDTATITTTFTRCTRAQAFPVVQYGALAIDIAQRLPPEQILALYNISEEALLELIKTPAMLMAIKDAKDKVREFGSKGGFVLRNQFVAEDLLSRVLTIARDPRTDPALVTKIFETTSRFGRLDPGTDKNKGGSTGPQVIFQLGAGIRGLEHLNPRVIVNEGGE